MGSSSRFSDSPVPCGLRARPWDNRTAIYKDELVVTDASGGHVRKLVWIGPWRGDPQSPTWAPDGKRLVFRRQVHDEQHERHRLRVSRAVCRERRRNRLAPHHPARPCDPVAARLVPRRQAHPLPNASRRRPERNRLEPLHHQTRRIQPPPADALRLLGARARGKLVADGRQIVFATTHQAEGRLTDLFVMNADGTGIKPITHTPNWEDDANWGPAT